MYNQRELNRIIAEKVTDFAGHQVLVKPLLCFEDEIIEQYILENHIEPPENWYRTGGDCICTTCNKVYYDHPHLFPWIVLHVLCNGDCVKL